MMQNIQRRVRTGLLADLVRGFDTLVHQLRMAASAIAVIVVIAVIAWIATVCIYVVKTTDPATRELARGHWASRAWCAVYLCNSQVSISGRDGNEYSAPAAEIVTQPGFTAAAGDVNAALGRGSVIGLWVGSCIVSLLIAGALWRGRRMREDTHMRGGKLAQPGEVARQLRRDGNASPDLRVGDVPLIKDSETGHILVAGTTGSGKTTLVENLLDAIRGRGDRAIIADVGGEMMSRHFRAGDRILGPFDFRSVDWSPHAERLSPADDDRLSKSMIPDSPDSREREWPLYAQSVVAAVMQRSAERGEATNERVMYYLTVASNEELRELVRGLPAQTLFDDGAAKMLASVRGIIGSYLSSYRYLPPAAGTDAWSIRSWVKYGTGWLWMPYRDDHAAALRPLLSAWIGEVTSAVLSLRPDRKRRIWLIVDECASLGRVQSLADNLTKGRKYGLCAVLGIQSLAQLRQIYGRDGAQILTDSANTWAVFRAGDPDTARWVSDGLGERELERADESLQYSAAEIRDAVSLRHVAEQERIVLPSELMQLPNLNCYVRLPGAYPICRTRIERRDRQQVCEPFIERVARGTESVSNAHAPVLHVGAGEPGRSETA
jgi:type IV conjugative transfer system coupling protein TraD